VREKQNGDIRTRKAKRLYTDEKSKTVIYGREKQNGYVRTRKAKRLYTDEKRSELGEIKRIRKGEWKERKKGRRCYFVCCLLCL